MLKASSANTDGTRVGIPTITPGMLAALVLVFVAMTVHVGLSRPEALAVVGWNGYGSPSTAVHVRLSWSEVPAVIIAIWGGGRGHSDAFARHAPGVRRNCQGHPSGRFGRDPRGDGEMLKRAHKGAFHKLSPKHPARYVQEFASRHNLREQDTIDIMGLVVTGMRGKRLQYDELIADNGLDSGTRRV